jgi:DNA polymerase III subunit beta
MNAHTSLAAVAVNLPALRRAVALCATIAHGHTIPILNYVRLHWQGDLTVTGYDLDQHLSVRVPASAVGVPAGWATCLPAKQLANLLALLPGDHVQLQPAGDGKITISGGPVLATINTMNAGDFPVVEAVDGEPLVWNAPALASDLAFVAPAITTEEISYYLNGICLATRDDQPEIVTTDGHRLHLARWPIGSPWPGGNPIVPHGAVALLRKMLAASPDDAWITARFAAQRHKASFAIGRFELLTKLIDGTYPAYERIFPAPDDAKASFAATGPALAAAIKLATCLNTEKTRAVRLIAADGQWQLQCQSPKHGVMACTVPGSTANETALWQERKETLAVNAAYLGQLASAFSPGSIEIEGNSTPSAPLTITSDAMPQRMALLMPTRV